MVGVPDGGKKLRICVPGNRLDTIPACDGRTDILHSPRYAYAPENTL